MTYDDWKTRDDTPHPDPNRCEVCGHPETYCDCLCCNEPKEGPMRAEDTNGLAGQAVIDRFVEWVKELLQERDRLRDAQSAYNAAADQVTHKRCESLEREIREQWQRREQAELHRAAALLDRDAANAAALMLKSENESLNTLSTDLAYERDTLTNTLRLRSQDYQQKLTEACAERDRLRETLAAKEKAQRANEDEFARERAVLHEALHTTGICPLLPGCWPTA